MAGQALHPPIRPTCEPVFMIQVGHEDLARVIGQGTTPAQSWPMVNGKAWRPTAVRDYSVPEERLRPKWQAIQEVEVSIPV